jgi:antitoxin HicB
MNETGKKTYVYTTILERDASGGYTVTCPALPGVATEGDTVEEAMEMAQDAIRGYLESLQKDGLPIPSETRALISPIRVEVADMMA